MSIKVCENYFFPESVTHPVVILGTTALEDFSMVLVIQDRSFSYFFRKT